LPGDNRTQRGKWTLVFFRFHLIPAIALLQAVRFSSNTFARYPRPALFYLCPDLFGGSRTPNLPLAASYYQPDELERILTDMDEKTRGRPYCIDVLFANKVDPYARSMAPGDQKGKLCQVTLSKKLD
jgi:hypothetical protein